MAGTTATVTIKGIFDASDIQNKVKQIQNVLNNIKMPDKLKSDFTKSFEGLDKALIDFQNKASKGVNNKQDAKSINTSYDNVIKQLEQVDRVVEKIRNETNNTVDLSSFIRIDGTIKQQLEDINKEISDLQKKLNNTNGEKLQQIDNLFKQLKTDASKSKIGEALDIFKDAKSLDDVEKAIELIEKARNSYSGLAAQGDTPAAKTAKEIQDSYSKIIGVMREFKTEAQGIQGQIDFKSDEKIKITTAAVEDLRNKTQEGVNGFKELKRSAEESGEPLKSLTSNMGQFGTEIDQVKNRIQYFFGLANAINLVKRAVRSAFNTVKELDAAMTETAVVTNFTIKDMWNQLSDYTARANRLGVTTKAAYESATLYYQQGLNTEQAAALSTETLKMARIAGLDAAEATDRMTNALRGFNMELNQTSAQRVDDVYSQLAAMSASNVDEISTAMTKVASLAHNANMEFETTAAFLSQIIETTRESAETAGTALKTVVARFSEVKKLFEKNDLKGQDEEGQIIDVNRVGQALRTAGIDLNKYFLGEVGLDDIFMELASKWNSLTSIQQRYIATQAAGSRQQSRFIALMQDYARTQELVSAAYNANGASEKQFEKTQDSLESKLARLKNAWNEFLMGLSNNAMIKSAIDALTGLLNVINKLTSAFGSGVGSFAKWGVAIGGLFGAKSLFKNGGIADKALISLLGNTVFGKILGYKGTGTDTGVAGAESGGTVAAAGGKTGGISLRTGGIGGLVKSIQNAKLLRIEKYDEYQKSVEDAVWGNALNNMSNFTSGKFKEPEIPSADALGGLGKLGLKLSKTGLGTKLAGTKAAGGIASALGMGSAGGAAGAGGVGTAAVAGLGAGLIYVAAAAAAAFAAYKLWENFTPEGHVKQAKKFAEAMKQVEVSASQARTETQQAYDTYNEKTQAINKTSSVTLQDKAIQDRNEYLSKLVQDNAQYAKYLKTDIENGRLILSIDEKDMNEIRQLAADGAKNAETALGLMQASLAGAEAASYRAKISRAGVDLEAKTIKEYDQNGSYYERAMTEKEIQQYTDYAVMASQKEAQSKAQATAMYGQLYADLNIENEDEISNLLVNSLGESFNETNYLRTVKSQEGARGFSWLRSRGYWQDEYQRKYGVAADTNMKTADIAKAIAQASALDEEKKRTEELSDLVSKNEDLVSILKFYTGDFTEVSGIDSFTETVSKIGLEEMNNLAKTLGTDVISLVNTLKDNYANEAKLQEQRKKDLGVRLGKNGINKETIKNLLSDLSPEDVGKILGFADAAEQSLGEGISNFYEKLPDYIKEGQLDNIAKLFEGVDLSQPLNTAKKLNAAIEDDTNQTVKNIAQDILDANKQLKDIGYLTQVFMTSEAYEAISEEIDKLIEKNGEITADNIEELTDSCSDLNFLMKDAEINAQGLARAFTAIGSGKASIEGISTAVLKALSNTRTTTTAVEKFFDSIDNFDEGIDFAKGINFANDKVKELRDSLEDLKFGNETFRKNYEYFFSDYEDFANLDATQRKSYLTEKLDRIDSLLKSNALGAFKELTEKNVGLTISSDNIMKWDLTGYTWDTLKEKIAKELEVSDQIAETVMTSAIQYLPNFREVLDENAFEIDFRKFSESVKGQTVVSEQELQLFGESYKKSVDEIKQYAEDNKIVLPIVVSWQEDGKNLTKDELLKKFRETFENFNIDKYKLKDAIGTSRANISPKTYDADTLLSDLQENYKLSSSQAKEVAEDYVKNAQGLFSKTIKIPIEGEIKEVEVSAKTLDDLEAEVKLKQQQAEWKGFADTLVETIQNEIETIDIKTLLNLPTNTDEVHDTAEKQMPAVGISTFFKAPSNSLGHYNEYLGGYEGQAKGGIVRSYAGGTRHISPGIALTGEEGPELVWNRKAGYAYFTGKNGPEFADLKPGDQVFPADETKDIIRRGVTPALAKGGKVYPSYSDSIVQGGAPIDESKSTSKKKSKSKKKKKDDAYDIDLDKYYNMVEDINELIRLRDLLEKDYNQLLKKEWKTGKNIFDILKRQLDLLEERRKITEDLAEKRKQQILDLVKENKQYEKYAWWNDTDQTIEINWDLVTKITDKDKGGKVKDYLSKLEDLQSKYDEQIEALEDIEDAVQDIRERGREEYISLEDRTRDALMKQIQDKIDELEDVDEAINDTNQKLFDSISQTLELQRQNRDNAKTEQELADKEKRLAYLRQDSSNANRVEIAKLEKELAQEHEDYTDTLIDQKISELQRQNEEAAEQRQEQIQLMQRSLDWQEKTGAFWDTVYQYISEGTDAVGGLIHQSDLENLLKKGENWDSLSEAQKEKWAGELVDQVAQGVAFLSINKQLETIGTKEGTEVTFKDKKGVEHTGIVDKKGNVVVQNEDGSTTTYTEVFKDYNNKYRTFEDEGETKPATNTGKGSGGDDGKKDSKSGGGAQYYWKTDTSKWESNDTHHWRIQRYYQKGYTNPINNKTRVDESTKKAHSWSTISSSSDKSTVTITYKCTVCGRTKTEKNTLKETGNKATYNPGRDQANGLIDTKPKNKKYATGGLADFTGPAWLDGTKSKPELVLNSRDTENFIQLKDVLADMRKGGNFALSGGDNYYDIDVHVDSLGSDYDVDRAIDRIKARLAQDGAYRNVNTLSRLR